ASAMVGVGWIPDAPVSAHCWVCAEEDAEIRRFCFWLLRERWHQPCVRDQLQRSGGFCRYHARHLWYQARDPNLPVLRFAVELLTLRGQQTHDRICWACAAQRQALARPYRWIESALTGAASGAGTPPMLCVPHLQMGAAFLSPAALSLSVELVVD